MPCKCDPFDRVPFDDFLPYITPDVKGVPDAIAAHNARLAAIQFGRETNMMERTIWSPTQEGVSFYPLEVEDGYSLLSIRSLTMNGRTLHPMDRLDGYVARGGYFMDGAHGLHIAAGSHDSARGLEAQVHVVPGQDSCYVDRAVYDLYAEVIAHGAKGRLFAMPSGSWHNPPMARYCMQMFSAGITDAAVLKGKAFSAEPRFMKPRRFV